MGAPGPGGHLRVDDHRCVAPGSGHTGPPTCPVRSVPEVATIVVRCSSLCRAGERSERTVMGMKVGRRVSRGFIHVGTSVTPLRCRATATRLQGLELLLGHTIVTTEISGRQRNWSPHGRVEGPGASAL